MRGSDDEEEAKSRRTGDARTVRDVFEAVPAAVVGLAGPEHTVVAVNSACRELTGRGDLVGRPVREVLPEAVGQQLIGALDRPFRTGRPETVTEWRVQLDRDGAGVPDELYVDCVIVPDRSPDGEIRGLVAIVHDVTGRVRERQAARRRAAEAARPRPETREVVDVLQRRLLPAGLPVLPGLPVGAGYLLADAEGAAGGDWFDAVPLPDGRTALVIGDVVGGGVAAAAAMGQLRAVLHDRLDETGGIGAALAAADRLADRLPGAHAATVCVAAVDPVDGRLTYCTAGHPPPLLIPSGGEARYLPPSGGGPLGTGSGFPLADDRLGIGDRLLLYTDGILERPGRDVAASTVEFARAAADVAAGRALREDWLPDVDRLTTQTLELLVRATGHADDVTLLAAQRTAVPPPLSLHAPAEPGTVRSIRKALDEWLYEIGARAEDVVLLRHGVGEVVANSVDHAYGTGSGTVRVRAEFAGDGTVEIAIADDGRWRGHRSPDEERGRGLAMAADFVDELSIAAGPSGTTATVRHRLLRPARLLSAEEVAPSPAAPERPEHPELLLILDQPSGAMPRIRVDGPIDAVNAPQLRDQLRLRTRGGTHPLTVDLTGVTHLSSTGVSVLYEVGGGADVPGHPLLLYAPPGSPAQHVLSTVAFPHTTIDPPLT